MSEFIDREKAIANIVAVYCCGCEHYNGEKCRACQIMDAMDVLEDEPAVVPDVQRWCNPETDLPKVETEVLVLYRRDDYLGITTAHYEDGNVFSEDSEWNWEDLPDWGTYDEERDDYRIPEGWWEYRHFNPDDVYNNKIDCPVVGWMPLPPEVLKMMMIPCKDCPDRHPICHDSCPKYAEYKRQLKAQRIYTNGNHATERISRNDFDKEGWMGGRKR